MGDKKKVPKIRFPEFTDEWEQRKLRDVAIRESTTVMSSDKNPSIEYEDVVSEEGRLNKDIQLKDMQKNGIAFNGSHVLYGKLRPYLHNWLNPNFRGVAVGDWWVLKPNKIDKNFLYRLIQTQKFDDVANQSTGSKMPRADWNLVSNTIFDIPNSVDEQCKIAKTFTNLDNLITLHQSKLDHLKLLKKSMLQKMFPRNGAKQPEVRFPGFADDWEQRKVGELIQSIPYKSFLKEPEKDGIFEIIQQGNEPIIGFANGNPCYEYKDTVIFGDHTLSVYKPIRPFFIATDGVRILQGRQHIDGLYLYSLLERYRPQSEGYKRYYNILSDKECQHTKNSDEQKQIGEYLRNLDNLITLHQREVEHLKLLKKGMLQKMFV